MPASNLPSSLPGFGRSCLASRSTALDRPGGAVKPSVPTMTRHRPPGSLPLRAQENSLVVMRNKVVETLAVAGAATEPGRRPAVVAASATVNPELSDRPKRRTFSAQEKLRILGEADRATAMGEIGALLRREGLYSSVLSDWRRQRKAGAFEALRPVKRGPKTAEPNPLSAELADLHRENGRLKRRLDRAEAIIDLQKKLSEMLGISLAPIDSDGTT